MESHAGTFQNFRAELMRFPAQHFSVAVLCNTGSANATALATQVADIYLADALQPRAPTGARPTEAKIDPAAFDKVAGDYEMNNGAQRPVMRFMRNGGQFYAQAPGQPPVEIFASSDTEFFAKVVDTRMTFHPDADGRVQSVTIHRARGDIDGARIPAPAAPAGELAQLAGTYRSDDLDAPLRLQVEDGHLFAYDARNRRIPLDAKGGDRFDLPGDGALTFKRSADRAAADGFTYSSTRVLNLWFARTTP
jgi:hypothetical protein